MNDIKTSERESLGQTVLRNLMHWHIEGKEMALKDVPTMAILMERWAATILKRASGRFQRKSSNSGRVRACRHSREHAAGAHPAQADLSLWIWV